MPTIINIQNADGKAQDIYVLQLQIRDATQKLTMPTLGKWLGGGRVAGHWYKVSRLGGGGGEGIGKERTIKSKGHKGCIS